MPEHTGITKDDLKEILTETVAAAITAAKAPNPLEEAELLRQKREMEAANKERETNSASVKAEAEAKRALQLICSHEHRNGDTHAVFIQEQSGPGYFLCQKNQCKIRPEPKPPKGDPRLDHNAIYDTKEFNRLFQKTANNEVFG